MDLLKAVAAAAAMAAVQAIITFLAHYNWSQLVASGMQAAAAYAAIKTKSA